MSAVLWALLNRLAFGLWGPVDQDDTERRADRAANRFVLVACLATVAVLVLITFLSGGHTENAGRYQSWTTSPNGRY